MTKALKDSGHIPEPCFWDAAYVPANDPSYTGNPLIDALPVIRTDEGWADQLLNLPSIHPADRELPAHFRAYKVMSLKDLYIPQSGAIELARRIDIALRTGYRYRDPSGPDRVATLQHTYAALQRAGKSERLIFGKPNPMLTLSAIGCSGMGKTTTVELILSSSYPQVVRHPNGMIQIVWMKLECPKGGDMLDLALEFISAFDRLVGTDRAGEARRSNAGEKELLAEAAHLCVVYNVGIVVIDELQNLCVKKSENREQMLNWLQGQVNTGKVPLLMMGTSRARRLLRPAMRHARRACVMGSSPWDPLPFGADFKFLVRVVWDLCWLREHTEISEEMFAAIYDETQGIKAFIVDMFLVVQLHALHRGVETITPELFRRVAQSDFAPVQPALAAIRSKQSHRLAEFDDLITFDVQDEIDRYEAMITKAAAEGGEQARTDASYVAQATSHVDSCLGVGAKAARDLVLAVTATGKYTSVRALVQAAIRLHYVGGSPEKDGTAE